MMKRNSRRSCWARLLGLHLLRVAPAAAYNLDVTLATSEQLPENLEEALAQLTSLTQQALAFWDMEA